MKTTEPSRLPQRPNAEPGGGPAGQTGARRGRSIRDRTLRAATVAVAVSAVVLTLAALVTFGIRSALGVAIGGALATANLLVFARMAGPSSPRRDTPWMVIAILKFLLLFGGVWLILRTGVFSPLALAFGYGVAPDRYRSREPLRPEAAR